MTIIEFLTARYDEDEASAQEFDRRGVWWPDEDHDPGECDECDHRRAHRSADERTAERVLADIAAKRAILRLHRPVDNSRKCRACLGSLDPVEPIPCPQYPCNTLRHLAAVYADHPDYREGWKV